MTPFARIIAAMMLAGTIATSGYAQSGAMNPDQMRMMGEHMQMMKLGPIVQGSVYNDWIYPVRHVQLRIQALDGSAAVQEEIYKFVLGDIGPGSRAYFVARVPAAAEYRVSVASSSGSAAADYSGGLSREGT